MAHYRKISVNIWRDPDFQKYSLEEKIVFFYLCTNPSATESGIYVITPGTISSESGVSFETVDHTLSNLGINNVRNLAYDVKTHTIFIKRYRLYNGGGAPALIRKAIQREHMITSTSPHWKEFVELYPEFQDIITTDKPLSNGLPTVKKRLFKPKKSANVKLPELVDDAIKNIKGYWNDCAEILNKKNISGMRKIRDLDKKNPALDSLIDKRLKEYNNNPGPILAAILNYCRLWQVPADKRKWTYGLWNLENFLKRADGDNVDRFSNFDAVIKSFTEGYDPKKAERDAAVDNKRNEEAAKYKKDIEDTIPTIRALTKEQRDDYEKSCDDLYTQSVAQEARRLVEREENQKKAEATK